MKHVAINLNLRRTDQTVHTLTSVTVSDTACIGAKE